MKCRDDSEIQKAAKYASKAISPKLFCNPMFLRDLLKYYYFLEIIVKQLRENFSSHFNQLV